MDSRRFFNENHEIIGERRSTNATSSLARTLPTIGRTEESLLLDIHNLKALIAIAKPFRAQATQRKYFSLTADCSKVERGLVFDVLSD